MNRSKAGKRVALLLAAAGTMVLLTCGAVLAAGVLKCEPNRTCGGTAKADLMRGSKAADKMNGKGSKDVMSGNRGADNMKGSTGNDTINGGPGNDTIMADDGELDSISCGLGEDVVFVDEADIDAEGTDFEDFIRLTSCETINEPERPTEEQPTVSE